MRYFAVLEYLGLDIGAGAVVCLTPEIMPITAQVHALPAWLVA